MENQKGFTLIELVVVIVILGILAAVAVPKFVDMQGDARISAVNGAAGAVKGAAALAHAQALIRMTTGNINAGTVTMEGAAVTIVNGYPATAAGGINVAVNVDGFTFAAGVFSLNGAPTPATCSVTYAQPVAPNGAPTYTVATAGCN